MTEKQQIQGFECPSLPVQGPDQWDWGFAEGWDEGFRVAFEAMLELFTYSVHGSERHASLVEGVDLSRSIQDKLNQISVS